MVAARINASRHGRWIVVAAIWIAVCAESCRGQGMAYSSNSYPLPPQVQTRRPRSAEAEIIDALNRGLFTPPAPIARPAPALTPRPVMPLPYPYPPRQANPRAVVPSAWKTLPKQPHLPQATVECPAPQRPSSVVEQSPCDDLELPPPPAEAVEEDSQDIVPASARQPGGVDWWDWWSQKFAWERWDSREALKEIIYYKSEDQSYDAKLYIEAAWLSQRFRQQHLPPLLAIGNAADPIPGAIGQPGTNVVLGDEDRDNGFHNGIRVHVLRWFRHGGTIGAEFGGFLLEQRAETHGIASDNGGNPTIAIPTFRPELGREGAFLISDPRRTLLGRIQYRFASQLWGSYGGARIKVVRTPFRSFDWFFGFRQLRLNESVESRANLNDPIAGITDDYQDNFSAENTFMGGILGFDWLCRWGWVSINTRGSIGLGNTHQSLLVDGRTVQRITGIPGAGDFPGGVLTQPTNMGIHSRNQLAFLSEVNVKLSVALSSGLQVFGGYDFLFWQDVIRPGEQIDHSVNRTQRAGGILTGPARPRVILQENDFWLHGFNVGFLLLF